MGRKSRAKRERQSADIADPVQVPKPDVRKRIAIATVAVVIVGVAVAIIAAVASIGGPAPASATGTTDNASMTPLEAAAAAIDFHPTRQPGVGVIESMPASAAMPQKGTYLLPAGSDAPLFTLTTPTGSTVSLADFRGKTVLLEFFATWCPHCQAEEPHLLELQKKLPASRFAFVAVNADSETAPSVYAFDQYFDIPYPTLVDVGSSPGTFYHEGGPGGVSEEYHVQIFPTFYIIDPKGRISWRADEEQPDALILSELQHASGG